MLSGPLRYLERLQQIFFAIRLADVVTAIVPEPAVFVANAIKILVIGPELPRSCPGTAWTGSGRRGNRMPVSALAVRLWLSGFGCPALVLWDWVPASCPKPGSALRSGRTGSALRRFGSEA